MRGICDVVLSVGVIRDFWGRIVAPEDFPVISHEHRPGILLVEPRGGIVGKLVDRRAALVLCCRKVVGDLKSCAGGRSVVIVVVVNRELENDI